jgi:dipeptidyl aminopeptidase/acylaminoacyl peptidase
MDGAVTYPPGFASGKKYPMMLYVDGGPRSASKTGLYLFAVDRVQRAVLTKLDWRAGVPAIR